MTINLFKDIRATIENRKKNILFLLSLLAILINFVLMLTHEAWRDEAQAWLISRDLSPIEMIRQMSYEGHPVLWYFILAPFSKLGFPYITINIISFIIMSVCILLIAYKSPFDLFTKICIIFSEMCIYHYAVVSRSYCLCALFIILIAIHYAKRFEHPIYFSILLAFLLQTHIIMAGMVFIIAVVHFIDVIYKYTHEKNCKKAKFLSTNIIGLVIVFLSGVFLLIELINVGNASDAGQLQTIADTNIIYTIKNCLSTLYEYGIVIFSSNVHIMVVLIVSIAVLLFTNRINKKIVIIGLFSVAWQLFIYQMWPASTQRLITWLYILLWVLWVSYDADLMGQIIDRCFAKLKTNRKFTYVCIIIIAFMIIMPFEKLTKDYTQEYSDAKDTAKFIEQLPKEAVIYENTEDFCNSVIPYLKTKQIINPFNGKKASYCDRNKNKAHSCNVDEFLDMCRKKNPNKNEIYLLCSDESNSIENVEEILSNSQIVYRSIGFVQVENYKLYKIKIR